MFTFSASTGLASETFPLNESFSTITEMVDDCGVEVVVLSSAAISGLWEDGRTPVVGDTTPVMTWAANTNRI